MPAKKYEFLEHTADICVKVYGRDLKELFQNAAAALFEIISEKKPGVPSQTKTLSVEKSAENLEELLIAWLNELISLSEARDLIFEGFNIQELTDNKIKAKLEGIGRGCLKIKTEVKAATYHELKIEKTDSGWQAKIIFDV
jgi:SHS2 domain-containing protein